MSTSRGSRYSRVRERSIVHRHKSITQTTINQYCSLTLLSATAGGHGTGLIAITTSQVYLESFLLTNSAIALQYDIVTLMIITKSEIKCTAIR